MFSKPHRAAFGRLRARPLGLAALSAALITSLAALPTASALANAGQPGADFLGVGTPASAHRRSAVPPQVVPGELLPAGQLESLLSTLPLNDLSAAQLAHYLAGLEGVSVLANLEVGLLSGKLLGEAGLEESLRKAIEQLGPAAKLGELAQVKGLLPALETALEGKLGGVLSVLFGALPGAESGLKSALGSLSLQQLAGSLLSSTKPEQQLATELSTLAGGLVGELGSEGKLGGLLGSGELTGGFAPMSVQEVAEELKTTPAAVSGALGQTAAHLPATTTMLTAPLTEGKLMGIAPAIKGLALGLLGGASETLGGGGGKGKGGEREGGGKGSGEGKGGSGEGSGKGSGEGTGSGGSGAGGQGGPGGTGSGGSAGGVTVLLSLPSASSTQRAAAAAKRKPGKVVILSHRVRGGVATIVLRVPAAGRVAVTGRGVHSAARHAAKAERLTLRVSLSKAATAALRRGHHHRLAVKLKASFKPTVGAGSSATVTVSFT
jgi:hypothetical protein